MTVLHSRKGAEQTEYGAAPLMCGSSAGIARADGCNVVVVESACYFDGSLELDHTILEMHPVVQERCSLDVHRRSDDDEQTSSGPADSKRGRPALLFVHGGTWRVGHRSAPMFSGQHAGLASNHDTVVVSVGYRRGRMPIHVCLCTYPGFVFIILAVLTSPLLVVAAVLAGWLPVSLALLPSGTILLVYYIFWQVYPANAGNFNSQCERGGGVSFGVMATDVARAVRWTSDHAERLGIDSKRIYLVGHSAGAHLVALLGADPRYLKAVGLPGPQCIAGICGLSGPYAPRQLHEESGLLIRLWLKATRTTVWQDEAATPAPVLWQEANPATHLSNTTSEARPQFVLMCGGKEGGELAAQSGSSSCRTALARLSSAGLYEQMVVFAAALAAHQYSVATHVVPGKNHATMISELGCGDDSVDTISPFFLERFGITRRPVSTATRDRRA